jgi:hypothetical protein
LRINSQRLSLLAALTLNALITATLVSALIGIRTSDTGLAAFFRTDKIPNDGRHNDKHNQNNHDVFHNQGLQQNDLALSDF